VGKQCYPAANASDGNAWSNSAHSELDLDGGLAISFFLFEVFRLVYSIHFAQGLSHGVCDNATINGVGGSTFQRVSRHLSVRREFFYFSFGFKLVLGLGLGGKFCFMKKSFTFLFF
jgi:hypothetical protein